MPPPMHIPGVFSANRLKVNLKLSVNRLKLLQQKKASVNAAQRKEIATLLENGKIESARVRVEHIIREDLLMEALEVIELYCELLLARFGLIESMATCDLAIQEAVHTLIYASPRVDVKELHQVRDQLAAKYGRDFANGALENRSDVVSRRVIAKLRVQTPDVFLVNQYLNEIAKAYKVDFHIDDEPAKPDDADLGKKTARTDPTGAYTSYDASDVGFTPSREYPVDPKRVPTTVPQRAPSPSSHQYAGQIITVPRRGFPARQQQPTTCRQATGPKWRFLSVTMRRSRKRYLTRTATRPLHPATTRPACRCRRSSRPRCRCPCQRPGCRTLACRHHCRPARARRMRAAKSRGLRRSMPRRCPWTRRGSGPRWRQATSSSSRTFHPVRPLRPAVGTPRTRFRVPADRPCLLLRKTSRRRCLRGPTLTSSRGGSRRSSGASKVL
ncbi:hypothetical protein AMAG_10409 [Allomyces macrogynus ATCC 38327]|uniref:Uncharacterized protein n=1 Tax=Allomyces macrogynus (strain ATCC 38327) TaxID=578462 RepID=A0A0L0SUZ6_ALLM3|nr:hypothetical protein AMAG_10409 [Allomyces macrogynus ATCC 38327]|eukprot:KNE66159.1 hypothetical protein AMAG_10409 [Allomyces macrogynus ATCC 38327]